MLELVGKAKTKNTWSSHFLDPFGYPPHGKLQHLSSLHTFFFF